MSRTFPSFDEIVAAAIAYWQIAHTDPAGNCPPLGPRTFLGQEARALANLISEVLGMAKGIDDDAIPGLYYDASGTLRTRNSARSLEDWANTLGLPSGVPGKYGRKGATAALGGEAVVTGPIGTPILTGSTLSDASGTVSFKVRAGFVIPISGSQTFIVDAVTLGEAARLPVGAVLRWISPPPGVPATVTLAAGLTGGSDSELDVSLALRIVGRLRDRIKGGSAADYREWCEGATDEFGVPLGITRAYVYPVRDGAGSVTIVITSGGTGQGRDPGSAIAAKCQTFVDEQKIATDTAYVVRPRFVSGEEITVEAKILPAPGYEFSFQDTVPMDAIGGVGSVVVVNVSPPAASLTTAIDNGNRPLLAWLDPSSPIPFVARALSYALNTPVPGQTTLALDRVIPAPPLGYRVHPGSLATLPVASAIAELVNSAGPSRSSGYANARDQWSDDVEIGALAAAVLSAVDSSGARVVWKDPKVGLGVGVTIAVGAGAPAGADFATFDNVPGAAPQLCELVGVIVKLAA